MSPQKKKLEAALDHLFSTPRSKKPAPASTPAAPTAETQPQADPEQPSAEAPANEPGPVENQAEIQIPDRPVPAVVEKVSDPEPEQAVEFLAFTTADTAPTPAAVVEAAPLQTIAVLAPAAPAPAPQAVISVPQPPAAPAIAVKSTPVAELSTEAHVELEQTTEQQLVVFILDGQYYGVDIALVESIIKMQAITPVPHARAYIRGVTNLRGRVLPVVSLRTRFGLPEMNISKDNRIIVIHIQKAEVGMIVDAVSEVLTVPDTEIEPTPPIATSLNSDYITGVAKVEDRLVILLDVARILSIQSQEK